jgi:hypothetical protein
MRSRSRWLVPLIGGLSLLGVLATLTWIAPRPPERRLRIHAQPSAPASPRTPCERTLGEARLWMMRAMQQANEERDALEAAAPEPVPGNVQEAWWRQRMARDHSGYLRQALTAAWRAATLARTPDETFHAALLLARLECYAGHHREELRQARRAVALHPEDPSALQALRHAAACNGVELIPQRRR